MHPGKSSFVTACQQLLALGAVFAVLAPATSVISLDVVSEAPAASHGGSAQVSLVEAAMVETEVVEAEVTEVDLAGAEVEPEPRVGRTHADSVTSTPQEVDGYGAVGVTWSQSDRIDDSDITLQARTQTDDTWSEWTDLEYHDEHGPDPASAEGKTARPGTDALLVGNVDEVQVKVEVAGSEEVPADLKLAVITPGESDGAEPQAPAIDTGAMDETPQSLGVTTSDGDSDEIALQAGSVTPKPTIYSRAQWGADESQRNASALNYNEVHAGFVHHTVTANDYTRAEVPGIIRSIYAYHTRSRGWSDVGYNFLIDRFGRIWEGRAGGVDRPVVGAHTLNYNDYAFAAAAIGNFETVQPSSALLTAYGTLFAWKLSLHGINPTSTKQRVGSRNFAAINGHRDAAATACPGRYLYAKIPSIRSLASTNQVGWSGRELDGDLASTAYPDLVVRDAASKMAFVIPTGGLARFHKPATSATGWGSMTAIAASPDLDRDGRADVVARDARGITRVYPGTGAGRFGAGKKATKKFKKVRLITAAGDLNRDKRNDLVAVRTRDGRLVAYLGTGKGTFKKRVLPQNFSRYTLLAGAGDVTGDGRPDLAAVDSAGRLFIHRGGKLSKRIAVSGNYKSVDALAGLGDFDRDGRADLVMRTTKGKGFLLPSRGDGTFGHLIGPLKALSGLTNISGGGQITGAPTADVVARSGDKLVVVRSVGTFHTGRPIATGLNLASSNKLLNVGDWDRDGYGDIVTRNAGTGALELRRGNGKGRFVAPVTIGVGFASVGMLAAVGDMTGDGYPDLMGQPAGSTMRIYPGRGRSGLGGGMVAYPAIRAVNQIGVGRWDGDGSPDTLVPTARGLRQYVGNGPGGFTGYRDLTINLSRYDWIGGISNLRGSGHPTLLVRTKATGDLWMIAATASKFGKPKFLGERFARYDLLG